MAATSTPIDDRTSKRLSLRDLKERFETMTGGNRRHSLTSDTVAQLNDPQFRSTFRDVAALWKEKDVEQGRKRSATSPSLSLSTSAAAVHLERGLERKGSLELRRSEEMGTRPANIGSGPVVISYERRLPCATPGVIHVVDTAVTPGIGRKAETKKRLEEARREIEREKKAVSDVQRQMADEWRRLTEEKQRLKVDRQRLTDEQNRMDTEKRKLWEQYKELESILARLYANGWADPRHVP